MRPAYKVTTNSTSHTLSYTFTLSKTFTSLSGNVEVVKLMISSGAQLEAFDVHFGPPLHIACAKGHVGCVKEMLKAGQKEDCMSQSVLYKLKDQCVRFCLVLDKKNAPSKQNAPKKAGFIIILHESEFYFITIIIPKHSHHFSCCESINPNKLA